MKISQSNLWFGTDESYSVFVDAQKQLEALYAQGENAIKMKIVEMKGGQGGDPFAMPSLLQVEGGVGVIDISGSLVNGSSGFMRLFGVLGYADIQQALQEAALSKDVKSVLLRVDSGGGQVNGVEDTGLAIRTLAADKPVTTYADGTMASAAYWLGVSADHVLGGNTSQVGSVGTLIVHTEISKALEQSGRKVTMVRFGDYKASANAYEPLSDKGKAELQSLADQSGQIFVDYTAERRGVTPAKFQATMGEGRVFMGQKAADVGLLDSITNLQGAIAYAKSLDKANTPAHNPAKPQRNSTMKAKLSKKTLLAIAAGVALDALGLSAPEANADGVKLEAQDLVALTAEATELIAARTASLPAVVDNAAAVTAATAPLTAQITELTAAAAKAKADLEAATGKVALAEAAATTLNGQLKVSTELGAELAAIVKDSASVMSVALGGTAESAAALVGAELLSEHARLKEQFAKKFPQGGVAAVQPLKPNVKAAGDGPSAMFRSLVTPLSK
jgi:signal peptide peptidase SppA